MAKIVVYDMNRKQVSERDLVEEVFNADVKEYLLHDMVRYQRAARRQGSAKVKSRGEIRGGGKKPYRQKGTGGARHGSKGAPIFRHGGTYKGPTPRSHAHDLTKKFRKLGLKHALSAKVAAGELVIVDTIEVKDAKTGALAKMVGALGWKRALIIDGAEVNADFKRAAANITTINVLPSQGANVYDILRSDTLVLTKAGVAALEARLA